MTLHFFRVQLAATFTDANAMRGRLGKALFGTPYYARLFAPEVETGGPSGLRNPPRPFVLRAAASRVHLFSGQSDARVVATALGEPNAPVDEVFCSLLHAAPSRAIRVHFKTPTSLKNVGRPEFAALFARARDRVSTLRAFYGEGPIPIDFRALGEEARHVRMTRCDLVQNDVTRRSGRTGQVHSIGGFTGVAEYEGELTPLLPILKAACYTGVGSKASWGNGWIEIEDLTARGNLRSV